MHRTTTILLAAALLLAGAVGCSSSGDDNAKDCATALSKKAGSDTSDQPTVKEANQRVDAFDKTLAGMVRSGYQDASKEAFDTVAAKTAEGGKGRPDACEPVAEKDYTALQMATAIDALGWTGEDGRFDKVKMADGLSG
ncbi:hypothetical protein [Streptomyces sp. SAS_275]|uniref:hypothetical protein n=1 Tax=Streptomyces sp. SAS_275 TaxID=3412746 RepID=UPI00403C19B2